MSILRCPGCRGGVLSAASVCPHCGSAVPFARMSAATRTTRGGSHRRAAMGLALGAIGGLAVIAGRDWMRAGQTELPVSAPVNAVAAALAAAEPATDPVPVVADASVGEEAAARPDRRAPVVAKASNPMRANEWLNLRETPSRASQVLLVVPPQAVVHADSAAPGWRRVAYDGAVGWVAEAHLIRLAQR